MSIFPCPSLRERFKKVVVLKVGSIGLAGDPFVVAWVPFVNGRAEEGGGIALRSSVDSSRYGGAFEGARGSMEGFRRMIESDQVDTALSLAVSLAELKLTVSRYVKSRARDGFEFAALRPAPVVGHALLQCIHDGLLMEKDCPRVWDIASIMAAAGMEPPATSAVEPLRCPVETAQRRGELLFEAIDLLEPR